MPQESRSWQLTPDIAVIIFSEGFLEANVPNVGSFGKETFEARFSHLANQRKIDINEVSNHSICCAESPLVKSKNAAP